MPITNLSSTKFLLQRAGALVAACCVAALTAVNALAAPPVEVISLSHTPPSIDALPYPGNSLKVTVIANGTRDTMRLMKALTVIDGTLSDIPAGRAALNEYDKPVYEFELHSPVAELSYQFLLYNPDGTITLSPRYALRRTCLPNIAATEVKADPTHDAMAKLNTFLGQAMSLESEVTSYQNSVSLLERLEKRLVQ